MLEAQFPPWAVNKPCSSLVDQRGSRPDFLETRRLSNARCGSVCLRVANKQRAAIRFGVSTRSNHSIRPEIFVPATGPRQIF
jgi:hypothetical protein